MPERTSQRASQDLRVNFFRPRPGFMRKEVTIIWLTLVAWGLVTFGLPLYVGMQHTDPVRTLEESPTLLGLPFYFLFEGQLVIVWFILICFIFNSLIDWLTTSYRSRR
ncbi:MAG: DUF4212 domain-containing protein [Desulfuromonadales bacterium]|nr:DUF4212 domain-containing protein [Desulfuromonadales bacterium]